MLRFLADVSGALLLSYVWFKCFRVVFNLEKSFIVDAQVKSIIYPHKNTKKDPQYTITALFRRNEQEYYVKIKGWTFPAPEIGTSIKAVVVDDNLDTAHIYNSGRWVSNLIALLLIPFIEMVILKDLILIYSLIIS